MEPKENSREVATSPNKMRTLVMSYSAQIAKAAPKHLTADRMLQIIFNEARRNPKLFSEKTDEKSLIGAIIQASILGLEPGGPLGHGYLVPYYNKGRGVYEIQFQIGYKGYIDLLYRSSRVGKVHAHVVHEKDHFEYEFGINEKLEHRPSKEPNPGAITHFYCTIHLTNGHVIFEVMSLAAVERIRDMSQGKDEIPWTKHFEEMGKKTVLRNLAKWSPTSIEVQSAVTLDEQGEYGMQMNELVLPGETKSLPASKAEELRSLITPQAKVDVVVGGTLSEEDKFEFEKEGK